MASELRNERKAWSVLIVSTLAFTVCFMVWMMFGVIGIPIKKMLNLNSTEFGLLTAMPVLTGSLVRVPLGIWTDRYGGRIVMAILMAITVPAIWLMSYATSYWHFLTIGLFVGLAGGSFSVGTPYVARWFPKERQGMAMGVYGAGNSGAAVNKFVAPVLLVAFGWAMVPQVYAAIMLGTRWAGSLWLNSQNSTSVPSMMAAYTCGTACQPKATRITGAMNLFTAAPELPAPYTPMARPWRCLGNQRAT